MRRRTFTALLSLFALMAVPAMAAGDVPAGYYPDQKAVYQNDGGVPDNATYFKHILGNLKNHVEAVGKDHVQIRVVDFGDGVDLFQMAAKDPKLAHQIDALKAEGVKFLICNNTLTQRKIDWHELHGVTEADIVPSGVAEIVRLQGMGFSYVHP
ncbi:DsrE family protein [Methylobacterium sp. NEAU K]|uniref:DsrE family protein n=1 Tax=Methylobacterium sp. NEAU K TaxID=3064946 RepID=UPI00351E7EAC